MTECKQESFRFTARFSRSSEPSEEQSGPIQPFETAEEITEFLREQWAGMFQRFLQEQDRARETSLILRLDQTATTLDRLVQFLSEQNETQSDVLAQIVLSNHPAFRRLAKVMGISFRACFETREELDKLLEAFGCTEDVFHCDVESSAWTRELKQLNKIAVLKVRDDLFAKDGRIQPQGATSWNDDWITREVEEIAAQSAEISDDDIPFWGVLCHRQNGAVWN